MRILITVMLVFLGGLASAAAPVKLTVFAAGTLARVWTQLSKSFEAQHPGVTVQVRFGGSVKMTKMITDLGLSADLLGVADYNIIPRYMFQKAPYQSRWYVAFVGNAFTFAYTPKSKGADQVDAQDWYHVLAEPGVHIGRSNPDTDPSGYQALWVLKLAGQYYHDPRLYGSIMKNAPQNYMRDTETSLLGALQTGEIDYLGIYVSSAVQHHLRYLKLPSDVNLSNPNLSASYRKVSVQAKSGHLVGTPILYAMTIPGNAPHPQWAAKLAAFLLSPVAQKVYRQSGFVPFTKGYSVGTVPTELSKVTQPWNP